MTGAHLEPATDAELDELKTAISNYRYWAHHNFLVKDVYDTYPDEFLQVATSPDRLDRLLFRLQLAEQNTLSAKLKRIGRAVVDAMACRF